MDAVRGTPEPIDNPGPRENSFKGQESRMPLQRSDQLYSGDFVS
jgi:hypothetical protein